MMPTLLVGDYLFVSKYSYGYSRITRSRSRRRCSPAASSASEAERGDVVVFRLPQGQLDRLHQARHRPAGRPHPDDRRRAPHQRRGRSSASASTTTSTSEDGAVQRVKRYRETLPNGVSYTTLDLTDNGFSTTRAVYVVPPGHYFMMGDNRDNSTDSRVLSQVGYVPFENLVGRAEIIFFSVGDGERGLGGLALALDGALEPAVHDRAMTARKRDATPQGRASTALEGSAIGRRASAATRPARSRPSRPDPCSALRTRAERAAASAATSGSNSSATTCSAWSSPTCCFAPFRDADEGELSRRLADLVRKRDLRRGRARDRPRRGDPARRLGGQCRRRARSRRSSPTSARR